jgi:hypothetical protein
MRARLAESCAELVQPRLADDHDRALRVHGDPVGGRAEQVVAEEVNAVSEHDQVEASGRRELGDDLGGVPGAELDLESDAGFRGSPSGLRRKASEERILLVSINATERPSSVLIMDAARIAPASSAAIASSLTLYLLEPRLQLVEAICGRAAVRREPHPATASPR